MGVLENKNRMIQLFGNNYTMASEGEARYDCPFCLKRRGKADRDGKFYVNIYNGKYNCFKCGAKGRLFKSSVAFSSNIDVYNRLFDMFREIKEDEVSDNDEDSNTFYIPNIKIRDGTLAYEYLESRGLGRDIIDYYDMRLGTDELFGRIVIPNIVYGERGIFTDMYSARSYTNQEPKYKNPKDAKKSDIVFNLHRIEDNCENIYILEGAITAICTGKDGVATYGAHPSEAQISMIAAKNAKNIYCNLDNDSAGREPNIKLAEKMSELCPESNVYLVFLPEGKDAADYGEKLYHEYVMDNRQLFFGNAYHKIYSYYSKHIDV